MSGDVDAPQSGITARVAVMLAAGLLFAYPFWVALGNLLNVPDYLQSQFGAAPEQIPWVLLVSDVARPVLIFLGGVVLMWKRGAGAMALILTTGFAVVNATALSTLAFEKEVELRLVIDFLTSS
jgi:hypothetical protein